MEISAITHERAAPLIEASDTRAALPVRSLAFQHLAAAAMFVALPHLIYAFLWSGPNHSTIAQDYLVNQPNQQMMFLQAVRHGYFPLWNPGENGGLPFASYLFAGQYWPATWLMLAVDSVFDGGQIEFLTRVRLLELGMAGFFTYLLMRSLGLGAIAAIFAGAAFSFNFRMLDTFRYGMGIDVVVWLPVLAYLAERILAQPSIPRALLYAAAQYLLIVPGHTQEALYAICFLNVYFILRLAMQAAPSQATTPPKLLAPRIFCFAGAQTLGLGLCAVMLLPFLSEGIVFLGGHTSGQPEFYSSPHLNGPEALYNLFFPWFADVHTGFYPAQAVWLALSVGLMALYHPRDGDSKHPRGVFVLLAIVLAFCLVYSLGSLTPLIHWVNACVPFLKLFRSPVRVMTVGMFALAAVSAYGIDRLLKDPGFRRAACRLLAIGCAVYLLAAAALAFGITDQRILFRPDRVYLPLLGDLARYSPLRIHDDVTMASRMACVIAATASLGFAATILLARRRITPKALVGVLFVAFLAEVGIYHRQGTWISDHPARTITSADFDRHDTFHTRTSFLPGFAAADAVPQHAPPGELQFAEAVPDRLKAFLSNGGQTAWHLYHQAVPGHHLPRAYITPTVLPTRGNATSAIAQANPHLASVIDFHDLANRAAPTDRALNALIPTDVPPPHNHPSPLIAPHPPLVTVEQYTPNKAVFTFETQTPGLFNYNDAYAPGWRARIDGRPTRIYRSNQVFKAVVVPPGRHRLEFFYDPPAFRAGLLISLAAACLCLALAAWTIPRTNRRRILSAAVTLAIALACATALHARIHRMVRHDGLMHYHPDSPAPPVLPHALLARSRSSWSARDDRFSGKKPLRNATTR